MKADRDLECDKCRQIIAKGEEYHLAAQTFTNKSDILCAACQKVKKSNEEFLCIVLIIVSIIGLLVVLIPFMM